MLLNLWLQEKKDPEMIDQEEIMMTDQEEISK